MSDGSLTQLYALLGSIVMGWFAYQTNKFNSEQRTRADAAALRETAAVEREKATVVRAEEQTKRADAAAIRVEQVKHDLEISQQKVAEFQVKQTTQLAEVAAKAEQVRKTAMDAATKVGEVKSTLETSTAISTEQLNGQDIKLDGLAKVARATHLLVNSNMENQLHINMVVTRRLAELTGNEADKRAADLSESAYDDHVLKQRTVDQSPGTDAQKSGSGSVSDNEDRPRGGFHTPLMPPGGSSPPASTH